MDVKTIMNKPEYDFLRTHPRLGDRIMLLGISGSYGYGTNRDGHGINQSGIFPDPTGRGKSRNDTRNSPGKFDSIENSPRNY